MAAHILRGWRTGLSSRRARHSGLAALVFLSLIVLSIIRPVEADTGEISRGKLVVASSFTQNVDGWHSSNVARQQMGAYHLISSDESSTRAWRGLDSKRVVVSVDLNFVSDNSDGLGAGLLLRTQGASEKYYAFLISRYGYFAVIRWDGRGKWTILSPWQKNAAVYDVSRTESSGLRNNLEVRTWDSIMEFHINGARVVRLEDSAYTSGGVGLFSNLSQHVAFDNFRLYEAEASGTLSVSATASTTGSPQPTVSRQPTVLRSEVPVAAAAPPSAVVTPAASPRADGISLGQKHILEELGTPEAFHVIRNGSDWIETWFYYEFHATFAFLNGDLVRESFEVKPLDKSKRRKRPGISPTAVTSKLDKSTIATIVGEKPKEINDEEFSGEKISIHLFAKGVTATFSSDGKLLTLLGYPYEF